MADTRPYVERIGLRPHLEKNGLWPLPQRVHVLESRALQCLFTVLRDQDTRNEQYVDCADRIMRILCEEGLARLPTVQPVTRESPCGSFQGFDYGVPCSELCCVSIVRSGDALMEAVRQVCKGITVGHILVQRNEDDPEKRPIYYYHKLPPNMESRVVLLVDPMLGTGGSACAALKCLLDAGVSEEAILFLNMVSCPEGIKVVVDKYPKVTIVTAALDPGMNEHKYIVPGLGDFGDRYYNTGDGCTSVPRKARGT